MQTVVKLLKRPFRNFERQITINYNHYKNMINHSENEGENEKEIT